MNDKSNKQYLFGRNVIIYDLIKFLTNKSHQKKVASLLGIDQAGTYEIGLFAINYCMDRKFFTDGAILINASNLFTN